MKYIFYLLSIIIIFGINVGLFGHLAISRQIPNLLFLLLINFAVDKKNLDFYFFAFFGGLLLDFYSTTYLGSYSLGFLLAGVIVYSLAGNLFFLEVNWKSLSLLLLGALMVLDLSVWFFNFSAFKFGWTNFYNPLNLYLNNFFIQFLYNWALLYPMYFVSNRLKDFINNFNIRSRGVVR